MGKQKLPWFSRLFRHSARKRGRLILQCSQAHSGLYTVSGKKRPP